MRYIPFLFLIFTVLGCQIDAISPARGKTVVPDTEARLARTLRLGGEDGKEVLAENRYNYNESGQLERIDWLSKVTSGNMVMYAYEAYTYGADGRLIRKSLFSRLPNTSEYRASTAFEYSYPSVDQAIETSYYINTSSGERTFSGRTETLRKNGQIVRLNRYYLDNNQRFIPQGSTLYSYEDGRLTLEEYQGSDGKTFSVFRYRYKGRTAQVESSSPNSTNSFITKSMLYDYKGRLIRQQYTPTIYPQLQYQSSTYLANYTMVFEYLD